MAKQCVIWTQTLHEECGEKVRVMGQQVVAINTWYTYENVLSIKIQNTGSDVIYVFKDNTYFQVDLGTQYFELVSESPYPIKKLRISFNNTPVQPA